ncbi:MAG: hypothetical protein HY482_01915 [Candidatus Wildermuthbacteria bacterium]|nr:hypothetical protein [Candidatus Wildermuthbacteria bacterium]
MANWKIRDIAPPRRREKDRAKPAMPQAPEPRPQKMAGKNSLLAKGLAVLVLLGIGSVGVLHVFFATAEVSIWPKTREIELHPVLKTIAEGSLDIENSLIPARTLDLAKEETKVFFASGKAAREQKAKGTIRVYNSYSSSAQVLVANTRFISEDGKLFRSIARVSVPGVSIVDGKQTPGFLDVEVAAAESGEEYNIGPATFSLPGLAGSSRYAAVYGKSQDAMTGGSRKEVAVVTQQDIEDAKDALMLQVIERSRQELLSRVPEDMISGDGALVTRFKEATASAQKGMEVEQFTVTASVKTSLYLFSRSDIAALAGALLSGDITANERAYEAGLRLDFAGISSANDTQEATVKMDMTAVAYEHIDDMEIKLRARGKGEAEATAALAQYESLKKSAFSFWPFWVHSVSGDVDKISVRVVID